jgi:quercetin dioxygenase-like cupin family protein
MVVAILPKHTFTYDGAQLNVHHANKGEGLPRHNHNFSHATICHNGSCVIRMEGKEKVIDKNSGAFNLPDKQWHEIEALEDDTVFVNIFAENIKQY